MRIGISLILKSPPDSMVLFCDICQIEKMRKGARNQKLFFYYEVYEPAEIEGGPQVRTSLAFYRGKVKVFETPVVERIALDATDRKAAVFQFEIPAGSFSPGLYTCQINIIDAAAGKFAFPRLAFYVR